jgi:hypothetical protein
MKLKNTKKEKRRRRKKKKKKISPMEAHSFLGSRGLMIGND